MMNIYDINSLLKQRPPFQMVERITELDPDGKTTGIKTVSINDPWFQGHFPGTPILPGVLIIEACAQVCSVSAQAASGENADGDGKLKVLLKVDGFKFLKPIIPGDVMEISVTRKGKASIIITYECVVTVAGECRAKGNVTFTEIDESAVLESGK